MDTPMNPKKLGVKRSNYGISCYYNKQIVFPNSTVSDSQFFLTLAEHDTQIHSEVVQFFTVTDHDLSLVLLLAY